MLLNSWLRYARLLPPRKRLEWYPPFRSMGVKLLELSDDGLEARIRLPLIRRNRNPGGSMFGGCMASLADPIPALACARLFPGYAVWTRSLAIDFLCEGRTDLELKFAFDHALRDRIAGELAEQGRSSPIFEYDYFLADGRRCARVRNRVAIRRLGYRTGGGALGRQGHAIVELDRRRRG